MGGSRLDPFPVAQRRDTDSQLRPLVQLSGKAATPRTAASWDSSNPGTGAPGLPSSRHDARNIARLRISLDDIKPEIWRAVDMPFTGDLKMLHDVIQAAMGWQDYRLWHFEAGERRYGRPDPEWPDSNLAAARNVKLGSLIERGVRQLMSDEIRLKGRSSPTHSIEITNPNGLRLHVNRYGDAVEIAA